MAITASMVKELREMTGAGMMDCKKALGETNGDMDAAVEYLSSVQFHGLYQFIDLLHIRNWLDSANFDHGRFAADSEESGAAFTDNLNIKLVTGSSKLKTRFCDSFILCFC